MEFPLLWSLGCGLQTLRSHSGGQLQKVTRPGEQGHKSSPALLIFHFPSLSFPFIPLFIFPQDFNIWFKKPKCYNVKYYYMFKMPLIQLKSSYRPITVFNVSGYYFIASLTASAPLLLPFSICLSSKSQGISLLLHFPHQCKLIHITWSDSILSALGYLPYQMGRPLHLIVW